MNSGDEPLRAWRVAAISFRPKKWDLAGNADSLVKAFRAAAKGGAHLAVAPEGVLEGYVVIPLIKGSQPLSKMYQVAQRQRGRMIGRFRKLARELGMGLVFGFAERIGNDVYNCAIVIDADGNICGKHHKMQLAEGSHPDWWFNRFGARARAIVSPFGRCGIMICHDRWSERLARVLTLDGAELLLIPSYGDCSIKNDRAVVARSRECNLPVVEANVGRTLIVDRGRIIAGSRKQNALTFATITVPSRNPIPRLRDKAEKAYLRLRKQMMRKYYLKTQREVKAGGTVAEHRETATSKQMTLRGPLRLAAVGPTRSTPQTRPPSPRQAGDFQKARLGDRRRVPSGTSRHLRGVPGHSRAERPDSMPDRAAGVTKRMKTAGQASRPLTTWAGTGPVSF